MVFITSPLDYSVVGFKAPAGSSKGGRFCGDELPIL
jgi:hypothetical protein